MEPEDRTTERCLTLFGEAVRLYSAPLDPVSAWWLDDTCGFLRETVASLRDPESVKPLEVESAEDAWARDMDKWLDEGWYGVPIQEDDEDGDLE